MSSTDLMTVEEAADRLGVSVATVRRRCASGELSARKVGKSWVVEVSALPPRRPRAQRRRPRAASAQVDLRRALTHLRYQDLRNDEWVPDILRHEDDLAQPEALIASAAARLDLEEPFDPARYIPVPKSPVFPRNAVDLSLTDRLAYQATVGRCADAIEPQLRPSVYSARLSDDPRHFLKNGRDAWIRWKHHVASAVRSDDGPWMGETDVTAFFDFIKHDILIPELQALGIDPTLIAALREMLRAWSITPNTGLPQGPNASRVLANFYMVPVDLAAESISGVRYFRYMDDMRIIGSSRAEVIAGLQELDAECRRRGLALSTKKTALHRGKAAIASIEDSELDDLQYAFDSHTIDEADLRKHLRRVFQSAVVAEGESKLGRARFSLSRLLRLRDDRVLPKVLENLELLAPLREIVPRYLHPWLRRASVQRRLTQFLFDPERNTSPFLSTWLMAPMLDLAPPLPDAWIDYARAIARDRAQPAYHRAVALNVLALSQHSRDRARIEDVIRGEYDPEVVRAAVVALARIGQLSRPMESRARRISGVSATIDYLRGKHDLPSLVVGSRVPVRRG